MTIPGSSQNISFKRITENALEVVARGGMRVKTDSTILRIAVVDTRQPSPQIADNHRKSS